MSYDPYVPGVLLGPVDEAAPPERYVTMGGVSEAADYALNSGASWRKGVALVHLPRILQARPFADRIERLLSIERKLDELPLGEERSSHVDQRFAIFGEHAIPRIVAACGEFL